MVFHIWNIWAVKREYAKAKFEILDGLSIDGTIILNGDDEFLWEKNGELDYETLYYGIENKSCDVVATDIKLYSCGSEFNVKNRWC